MPSFTYHQLNASYRGYPRLIFSQALSSFSSNPIHLIHIYLVQH